MSFGFLSISASTKRLIILTAASALLLAAGNVSQADAVVGGPEISPEISDAILAPMTPAEAAASAAALAATTPDDIAAAARMRLANADDVSFDGAAAARPARLTTLVAQMDSTDVTSDRDLNCLATAVYFEARGEPMEGQLAVAQAIINRVESGRYADTICGVVNQPKQFSFDRTRTPRGGNDWVVAQAIAKIAANDLWHEVAPRALSFHAVRVSPNWAGKTRVATIGNHVFYR
ncbi:MAG: cell wall hydrolase [Polymorphobacter sp.]